MNHFLIILRNFTMLVYDNLMEENIESCCLQRNHNK